MKSKATKRGDEHDQSAGRRATKRQADCWIVSLVLATVCAAVYLIPARAQSESLQPGDDIDYPRIIVEMERMFGGFYQKVDLHIVNPHLYFKLEKGQVPPVLDLSGLETKLRRRIVGKVPFFVSMRITREIPRVLVQGESATAIYPLANGRYLCLIVGLNGDFTVAGAVARYAGVESPVIPEWMVFKKRDFLRFLIYHEIAHCSAAMTKQNTRWTPYDILAAETLGDVFAVLMHLRDTNDDTLPRVFALMRQAALVNSADREHMTARAISAALKWRSSTPAGRSISAMNARRLFAQAKRLAKSHLYTRAEFASMIDDEAWRSHENPLTNESLWERR